MQSLVEWGLANAATAALLALGVAVITRVWRNPHLAHLLWLVVLLRLVAPPVVQIPLHLPDWRGPQIVPARAGDSLHVAIAEPSRVSGAAATESRPPAPLFAPSAGPSAPSFPSTLPTEPPVPAVEQSASFTSTQSVSKPIPIWNVLAGIWMSGSLLYVAVTVARVNRFGRAVRRSPTTAPAWLEPELREIAQAIGLRRLPRVSVVEWALPPMIWSGARPTLLVPQALVTSIDPVQRRLLLLHELLHIRRRDHLTRWFAIAVLALYWWNPFAWWAVRKLQNAEEECCDAAVLTFDPKQSEIYGEALLAVSEFVSCGSLPAPAVSVGVERKNHLKRRMTMILEGTLWPNLSKARLAVVTSCGALALGISLTMVAAQAGSTDEGQGPPVTTGQALSAIRSEGMPVLDPIAGVGGTPAWGMPITGTPIGLQVRNHNVSDSMPAMLTPNPLSQPSPDDGDAYKLVKDRYRAALQILQRECRGSLTEPFPVNMTNIGVAGRVLLDCELALAGPRDKLGIYERYLELATLLDRRADGLLKAKLISLEDCLAVHKRRLDAEAKLREYREKSSLVLEDPKQPSETRTKDASTVLSDLLTMPLEPVVAEDDVHRQFKRRYAHALKTLQLQYTAECRLCHANKKGPLGPDEQAAYRELLGNPFSHPSATSSPGNERRAVSVQSLQLRVRIAEAEVAAARALTHQNEAELKRALTNLKYRETTLARIDQLRKHNSVSQGEVDEATHLRDDAAANVEAARAATAGAEAQGAIKVAQLEQVQLELKQAKEAGK